MGCEYTLFGETYTEQELIQALKNDKALAQKIKAYEQSYDPDEIEFDDTEPESQIVLNRYDKLIQYKRSLISQLNNKIANLKSIIKGHTDKDKVLEDTKLMQKLERRVDSLEADIDEALVNKGLDMPALKHQAKTDAKRVEELLATEKIEDAAKRLGSAQESIKQSINRLKGEQRRLEQEKAGLPFFAKLIIILVIIILIIIAYKIFRTKGKEEGEEEREFGEMPVEEEPPGE